MLSPIERTRGRAKSGRDPISDEYALRVLCSALMNSDNPRQHKSYDEISSCSSRLENAVGGASQRETRRRCSKYKPLTNCHRFSLGWRQKCPRRLPGVHKGSKTDGLRVKMLVFLFITISHRKSKSGTRSIRRAGRGLQPKVGICFLSKHLSSVARGS